MLDIGIFELLFIAVIGLLILGPEKLPGYIAQGIKFLQNFRDTANKAKNDIIESSGLSDLGITDLNPNKIASQVFSDNDKSSKIKSQKFDTDIT